MKTVITDDMKNYNDVLSEDERKVLIKYLNDKIDYLKKDTVILRDDYNKYSSVIRRFVEEDAIESFVKRIINDYKCEVATANEKILKTLDKKFTLDINLPKDEKEEQIKKYTRYMVDCCMESLNFCKSCEVQDVSYYKRVIDKLENNGVVNYNDGQELWCLCDNLEHDGKHNDLHLSIIKKLKEYTSTLADDGLED